MTFLAPVFLVAAALGAAVVVGLHFLSTRDPRLELFPTARFVPDEPLRAQTITARLTDVALLILRALLVLLVGAALARPVLTPPREPVARIVAVDVSRAVGRPAELLDSARAHLADAAAVILFDSAARVVPGDARDSLLSASAGSLDAAPRGSLSAALVVALRTATKLRDRADSLELVVVSPFAAEERDAATATIRDLWPGRVTTVKVAARGATGRRDSVRVEWADSAASDLWAVRARRDTVGAVRAGDAVMVYPFERAWRLRGGGSPMRVLARWADGEPAAVERSVPGGCVRSLGFALPSEGDARLRPDFQRFAAGLSAPCGEPRDFAPLPDDAMASLRGRGPLAATATIGRSIERATPLMPWILGLALVLALAEMLLRRPRAERSSSVRASDEPRPAGRSGDAATGGRAA